MTKRHVTYVQSLYSHILDDMAIELPELREELCRDMLRLSSALENHGLRFATIDMVDFGKHLDQCLSRSRLSCFVGPHMRPFKRGGVIPRLFKGLFLRVFQHNGCLLPTPCHISIRFLRQMFYLAKKIRMNCEESRTFETVRKFFEVDAKLLSPTLDWDSDHIDWSRLPILRLDDSYPSPALLKEPLLPGFEEYTWLPRDFISSIQTTGDIVSNLIGIFDPYQWRTKHGPGAVSDLKGDSKYEFPFWPKKLDTIFPLADFAFANLDNWVDCLSSGEHVGRFSEREPASKLIAVPKTQKGPRLIASEPTAHQWCQQSIKAFLYDRVQHSWLSKSIHFRDQTFNQRLAQSASINRSHWTIDLSEASDRVSCYVVERLFRGNVSLLRAFHAVRTRTISNDIDQKLPRLLKMKKFSTMGSALTFPVQSLVFLIIILGSLCYSRKIKVTEKNLERLVREVLVFGDDLIVPDDVGPFVLGSLRYLGFEVNRSKTFGKGSFRESCGGEYFDGHDVTPNYFLTYPDRRRPESLVSCVEVRNNFFRNGYDRCADYIKSTTVKEGKIILPSAGRDSGMTCWETHGILDVSGLHRRFDRHLHVSMVRAHQLTAVTPVRPDRYTSRVLQYFTEAPPQDISWSGGVRGRPKLHLKLRWVALP
ncbi:MAG: putative replicase protein [Alehxovirus faecivivens]|uniref:RNA-directed RNA polymerase n=1 Tax=Leviviridae sp. TaxID=2027243 RepID=A0ABY3SU10_9VIRU|nr:MAG: putative replicase protein [Leviviridae sp.]